MFTKKGDAAVLAKLGEARAEYREIGQRLHGLVRENAQSLEPIVRWGLPFYVNDGKDICYQTGQGLHRVRREIKVGSVEAVGKAVTMATQDASRVTA